MSKCVVRMKMPSNCWVCPFGSDRFIWDENNGRPHYVMVRFCSRHSGEEFHVLETDTIDRPWFCDSFICQLPEGHGRLVDADAYRAEMKDRQDAAWEWRNEAIEEEDEVKLARAEGAYTAFTEAKLTMDKHIINPWHRVEEPPKENGRYFVSWEGAVTTDEYKNGVWLYASMFNLRVTHWMPIPEPPKEDA